MSYKRIGPEGSVPRSFQMTIGLSSGYVFSDSASSKDVVEAIGNWMMNRMEEHLPIITGGIVVSGEVVYSWNSANTGLKIMNEEVALYMGEVNPLYNANLSDKEAVEVLTDLASYLGEKFHQTRMYFTFFHEIFILQKEGEAHPTESPS